MWLFLFMLKVRILLKELKIEFEWYSALELDTFVGKDELNGIHP
jgi:hypothetical protein